MLRDIRFNLVPGDVLGIVGPSAAGKTLLMRAIAGIVPLKTGAVRLDDAAMTQWDRNRLGPYIGYLPQESELIDGTVGKHRPLRPN